MEEKKKWFPDGKKLKKENFLVILLLGVLLLVIALPVSSDDTENKSSKSGITDTGSGILALSGNNTMQSSGVSAGEGTASDPAEAAVNPYSAEQYAAALSAQLEALLSTMEGAGKVKVMITLADTGEAVVEKDSYQEIGGSTQVTGEGESMNTSERRQEDQTVYAEGNDSTIPYVRQTISPRIAGVVVCAQGGASQSVNKNITEAIQALFGIEAHKIKVIKMSTK